jgi:hypothetical protein
VVADHAATLTNFTPAMLNLAPCDATIESSASQSTVIAYTGRGVFDAFKIAQVDGVNKGYDDVGVYGVCKGAHVSTFALDIPSDGKITATFNMACLDYADSETSIVVSPNAPTTTPFLSNNNVGTILVNGQSLEGVACVSAMTVTSTTACKHNAASVLTVSAGCAHCDRGSDHRQHHAGLVEAGVGDLEEHLHPSADRRRVPDHRQPGQQVHIQLPGGGS